MVGKLLTWLLFRGISGMTFAPLELSEKQRDEWITIVMSEVVKKVTRLEESHMSFGIVVNSTKDVFESLAEAYERVGEGNDQTYQN